MMTVIPLQVDGKMRDKFQPGAFIGTTFLANAIENAVTVYHGVSGCHAMTAHFRTDLVPNGVYAPVIPTGVFETETIMGGGHKLEKVLRDIAAGKVKQVARQPDVIWVSLSDVPAIAGDAISDISKVVSEDTGVTIIPVDNPGFRGGVAKGTDLAIVALLERVVKPYSGPKEGINLLAPALMGSANWPFDIDYIIDMLKAADVKINLVLSRNTKFSDIEHFARAEANYFLTYDDFPLTEKKFKELGLEIWGRDLVLPYGVGNTEEWYLKVAERFGDVEKARTYLAQEMEEVKKVLKANYNFSWMASMLSEKYAAVCGYAPFAAALTRYLFYDLNMRVKVVGLWSETLQGIKRAEQILEPLSDYMDFVVMEDPTYYQLGQEVKKADPDFVIGSIQDKPLFGGLGFPHLNLAGFYFFNNYNFIPWPAAGVRGSLRLFSEICKVMEQTFFETEAWKKLAYTPLDS